MMILAHRGAPREAPENTLSSFQRSLALGAKAIECDVVLSRERVPVVTHNDRLFPLTGMKGRVRQSDITTLRTLDFGSHFSEEFQGERLPLLVEVLDFLKKRNITLYIDVKQQLGLEKIGAEVIGKHLSLLPEKENVIVASHSLLFLAHFKQLFPQIQRSLTIAGGLSAQFQYHVTLPLTRPHIVSLSLRMLHPSLMANIRKQGCRIFVWTVNTEHDIVRCLDMGVDGIFTDDFEMAHRILGD